MSKIEQMNNGGLELTIRVRQGEPIYLPVGTYRLVRDIKVPDEEFLIQGCRVEGGGWGTGKEEEK